MVLHYIFLMLINIFGEKGLTARPWIQAEAKLAGYYFRWTTVCGISSKDSRARVRYISKVWLISIRSLTTLLGKFLFYCVKLNTLHRHPSPLAFRNSLNLEAIDSTRCWKHADLKHHTTAAYLSVAPLNWDLMIVCLSGINQLSCSFN